MVTSTRTTRWIGAQPPEIYRAFTDPASLVTWLPPGNMTGQIHDFEPGVGGGYTMSLFYPPGETRFKGKTAEGEDRVEVRFVAMAPPFRLVEAVRFISGDPMLQGEMALTITLREETGGTEVVMRFDNLPPGLRPEDNDAGARLSLEQLAQHVEGHGDT